MCGKRMPKSMWAYFLVQFYLDRQIFYDGENHGSCELAPSPVQKQSISKLFLYIQMNSNAVLINMNIFLRRFPDRHKPIFIAFPGYFDKSFIKIQIRNFY